MTAPEREALVKRLSDALRKVRPLGGSELFMKFGGGYVADPDYCGALIEQMRHDLSEANKTIARLRKAHAPAVTVTEDARDIINSNIVDAFVKAIEDYGDNKTSRRQDFRHALTAVAPLIIARALKSTTPQTGSQE